jgi:coproporphyrinogen III oxidase-like Fe-S oxidoreductase
MVSGRKLVAQTHKRAGDFVGLLTRQLSKKFLQLNEASIKQEFSVTETNSDASLPLYVHIPFCRTLCPFCCFSRHLYSENRVRRYFDNLKKELNFYIQKGFTFSNFYFGGGTPTILMDELVGFIDYLNENFTVEKISLETTLREINSDNIDFLKDAGINRLSVGIQSFDNQLLKSMGRSTSTGEQAKDRIAMVQGRFDTVNADFIFNFPTQTIDKFAFDLNTFKNLGIDQATFYPMMPSPNKLDTLKRRFERVDTSREKDFYDLLLTEIHQKGYTASTVWCFSRGDRIIDEYIVDFDDYIGIGSSALSFHKGNFYVNTFSLKRYEKNVSKGKFPVVLWKRLTEREHFHYYMLTKLFGTSIDPQKFRKRFHSDIHDRLKFELLFFKTLGFVEEKAKINVTPKGMYTVSVMMKEFFTGINRLREKCIENGI